MELMKILRFTKIEYLGLKAILISEESANPLVILSPADIDRLIKKYKQ